MLRNANPIDARDLLLERVRSVGTEQVDLWEAYGRVLAEDVLAVENVPPFDRSPYDGYAFCSADSEGAGRENPVQLRVIGEAAAGGTPPPCLPGTAVKILTGAPIPEGADAVVMYEKTEFTSSVVKLFAPAKRGENIIYAGEDIRKGDVLARKGFRLDVGAVGTLASQGIAAPVVYRTPRIGILSTGNELVEPGQALAPGRIYNSNRFTLMAALRRMGCEPIYLGMAGDSTQQIAEKLRQGLDSCDAVLSTGGVSAGDYDLTPDAMQAAGVDVMIRGVGIKPGMACAYGVQDGKPVCALSGNPASSLTNLYAVAMPALKKLCGVEPALPEEITLTLGSGFKKKSGNTRLLRGRLDLSDGTVRLDLPQNQGNVILSSMIGCDAMAVVPAGSGPLNVGDELKGFRL